MATKQSTKTAKVDNAATNRIKRLNRTLKKQPNNLQVQTALKTTRMHRKTPVKQVWSHSAIAMAKLFKKFTGKFNMDILSKNEKLSGPARMMRTETPQSPLPPAPKGSMFSLELRATQPANSK